MWQLARTEYLFIYILTLHSTIDYWASAKILRVEIPEVSFCFQMISIYESIKHGEGLLAATDSRKMIHHPDNDSPESFISGE